jgi:hypothetical protein
VLVAAGEGDAAEEPFDTALRAQLDTDPDVCLPDLLLVEARRALNRCDLDAVALGLSETAERFFSRPRPWPAWSDALSGGGPHSLHRSKAERVDRHGPDPALNAHRAAPRAGPSDVN